MNAVTALPIGTAICRALGIDTKMVTRVEMDLEASNPHTALIKIHVLGTKDVAELDWQELLKGVAVEVIITEPDE